MGLLCFTANAQFHDKNIPKITSVKAAEEYAGRYSEVSFGLVNSEMDVFLFDNVDTTDMPSSVGTINTIYRRRTKFLKDTTITMLNVQVIEFDSGRISLDSANFLIAEIIKKYENGTSYWNLMKEYRNESCKFEGGPVSTELLKERFGSTLEQRRKDEVFKWSYSNRPNLPIVIIIHEEAHSVPAFYAISYNISGR
jgi:hypothetical protein